jgi:hypothetical protein
MKLTIITILSIIEIPLILLSWTDYYWNLIIKLFSSISILFIIPGILTMPITWLHSFSLAFIVYIKQNLLNNKITFYEAIDLNLNRFPHL